MWHGRVCLFWLYCTERIIVNISIDCLFMICIICSTAIVHYISCITGSTNTCNGDIYDNNIKKY